ncbi:MAG: hypothetical protein F4086_16125 [Gemmatimonadetes bacterium]|nr:hypothetical protein [Gemmatimonadota bacterium]
MSDQARTWTAEDRARWAAAARLAAAAIENGEPLPPCPCPECGGDLFEVLVQTLDAGAAAAVDQAQANMSASRLLRESLRERDP